jgi:hypothetical protein
MHVLIQWLKGRAASTEALQTDGTVLYSYMTLIARVDRASRTIKLQKLPEPSSTQKRHLRAVHEAAEGWGFTVKGGAR